MILNIINSTLNPLKLHTQSPGSDLPGSHWDTSKWDPSNRDPGHHYHTGINFHPTEMMTSHCDLIIPVVSRWDPSLIFCRVASTK